MALFVIKVYLNQKRKKLLSPDILSLYENFIQSTNNVMTMFYVYIEGFEYIKNSGRIDYPPHVLQWAHFNASNSPHMIAGLVSVNLCAILEEFLTRIKITKSYKQNTNTKPSMKNGGEVWIKNVSDVFGIAFDDLTKTSLLKMISVRNDYAHEPQKKYWKYHHW